MLNLSINMSSVSERNGTIGTVKGSGESEVFQAKANFCLKIVAKVEGTKDGYIARVTRAPDDVTRYIYNVFVIIIESLFYACRSAE